MSLGGAIVGSVERGEQDILEMAVDLAESLVELGRLDGLTLMVLFGHEILVILIKGAHPRLHE